MAQFFWEATDRGGKGYTGVCPDREAVDRILESRAWAAFNAQTFDSMSSGERVKAWCALGWSYQIEPAGIQLAMFGKDEPMLAVSYRGTRILVSQRDLDGVKAKYQDVLRFEATD